MKVLIKTMKVLGLLLTLPSAVLADTEYSLVKFKKEALPVDVVHVLVGEYAYKRGMKQAIESAQEKFRKTISGAKSARGMINLNADMVNVFLIEKFKNLDMEKFKYLAGNKGKKFQDTTRKFEIQGIFPRKEDRRPRKMAPTKGQVQYSCEGSYGSKVTESKKAIAINLKLNCKYLCRQFFAGNSVRVQDNKYCEDDQKQGAGLDALMKGVRTLVETAKFEDGVYSYIKIPQSYSKTPFEVEQSFYNQFILGKKQEFQYEREIEERGSRIQSK
jgi:hypothetical protein